MGTPQLIDCRHCQKPFPMPVPSQVRSGHGKFCSRACYWTHPRPKVPIEERFWRHVHKTASCWLWTGGRIKFGYGFMGTGGRRVGGGAKILAHRVSWEIHRGPIPVGLCVLHNCPGGDNPACVNPDHLFLGTKKDNYDDMCRKGRYRTRPARGEEVNTARLTEVQVREIRARVAAGGVKPVELAAEYGVTRHTIRHVVSRHTWKHVA